MMPNTGLRKTRTACRYVLGAAVVGFLLLCTSGESWALDRTEVRQRLLAGDYAGLTADLTALDVAYNTNGASVWNIAEAYQPFRTSDPAVATAIEGWIAADPVAYPAHIARAVQLGHLSKLLRGLDIGVYPGGPAWAASLEPLKPAWEDLIKALNPDGHKPVGLAEVIMIHLVRGQERQAADFYDHLSKNGYNSALLRRAFATRFEPWWSNSTTDWSVPLRDLRQFIETTPDTLTVDPDFEWRLGHYEFVVAEAARRKGDFKKAIDGFTQAIAARERTEYFQWRGIARLQSGERPAALEDFEKAVALDPYNADAHSQIGGMKRLDGDLDAALAAYERAVALDPLNPEYLCGRASVLVLLDRGGEARADVDKALTYGQYSPWVQIWRAHLYRDIDPQVSAEAERLAAEYQAPTTN